MRDKRLRALAEWYPTNRLARDAVERAKKKVASAESIQSRQAWEETLANLQRLIAIRS